MAKYNFVVLTNPTQGKEAEYNDWYNNIHIPDVLNVKGMVGAQRFRLADQQMGGKPQHSYLALYEIETDNLAGDAGRSEIAQRHRRYGADRCDRFERREWRDLHAGSRKSLDEGRAASAPRGCRSLSGGHR